MHAPSERQFASWVWLALGLILLCAATIHGRDLLAQHEQSSAQTGGTGYAYVQLPSLGDATSPSAAQDTATGALPDRQSLLGLPFSDGKVISRVYAAMMRANNVQELEN